MKNIILSLIVLSFGLTTHARHRNHSQPDNLGAVTHAEAEQYSKILAKMGNYSLYCDMAKATNDRALATAYAEKHQSWRDLDRKSWVPFGGEDAFDNNNTKEFNLASSAFIHLRDGHPAEGGGAAVAGIGSQAACAQGLEEFNQLLGKNSRELLSHIREVLSAASAPETSSEGD